MSAERAGCSDRRGCLEACFTVKRNVAHERGYAGQAFCFRRLVVRVQFVSMTVLFIPSVSPVRGTRAPRCSVASSLLLP